MWLLGLQVKSLLAYKKALGVDKYSWAKKAEVSTLLYAAYPRSSKEELKKLIINFENGNPLPPFNLVIMQDITCKTEGIPLTNEEKVQVIRDANIEPVVYIPKKNKSLHCQRQISAYKFKFDGERLEELKEKFYIGDLYRVAWGKFLPIAFAFGKSPKRIKENLENWKRTGRFIDELNYAGINQYVSEFKSRFIAKERSNRTKEST